MASLSQSAAYPGGIRNFQLISYFLNLSLKETGVYKIKINFDGKNMEELPLRVAKTPPAPKTPN